MCNSNTIVYSFGSYVFEWHRLKAEMNVRKHGITVEEAATIFGDNRGVIINDPEHSEDELRQLLLGSSAKRKLLAVVHVERGVRFRIISAREATRKERMTYDRERRVGI